MIPGHLAKTDVPEVATKQVDEVVAPAANANGLLLHEAQKLEDGNNVDADDNVKPMEHVAVTPIVNEDSQPQLQPQPIEDWTMVEPESAEPLPVIAESEAPLFSPKAAPSPSLDLKTVAPNQLSPTEVPLPHSPDPSNTSNASSPVI